MKVLILLVIFSCLRSYGDNSLFVGPVIGGTTYNPSNGSASKSSDATYGAQAFFKMNRWVGGLDYSYFSSGISGNETLNVSQSNQWIDFGVKFTFLEGSFSPFVGVGAGPLYQTVTTTLYNENESNQGTFFVRDAGIGVIGRFLNDFGVVVSAKYYEYSNVNGFNYAISLGYFPIL